MNTFSDPRMIIEQLPIFAGQKIADFGAGSGAYTFLLSKKVGGNTEGMVYAIDVKKQMLEHIAKEAKEKKMLNVQTIWSDLDEPKGSRLRDNSMQMVFVANMLFCTDSPKDVISEALRVLAPGGELVVIDWSDSFGNIGPKPDHIISEQETIAMVQELGFAVERTLKVGEHHYGFMAIKNK